jgi:predicted RNA binding protein YcfA (HicA-like mRNA interferase family)
LLLLKKTAREVITKLKKEGWVVKNQKGSHLQMEHPVNKGKVTVPIHGGDIPKGTLYSILRQAGLK